MFFIGRMVPSGPWDPTITLKIGVKKAQKVQIQTYIKRFYILLIQQNNVTARVSYSNRGFASDDKNHGLNIPWLWIYGLTVMTLTPEYLLWSCISNLCLIKITLHYYETKIKVRNI